MSRKTDTVVARTIGIDTGKNTLHLIGLDDRGAIVLREKLTRGRIAARLANVPQCLIGIEAGMATHCVARELIALGHDVKQVPPVYAKPFRHGHKNDFRDAHAIAEAVQRPSTRCVPVKSDDQLDLQALHRVRSRLISERTAVINLWSTVFRYAKGFASCVSSSRTSWLGASTCYHPVSSGLLRISVAIGGGSMSVLNTSLKRSKSWHAVPRAAGS
jgi:hypothetical protein